MRFLASLLLLASVVAGAPSFTRNDAPHGWHLGARAPGTENISFTIALKQRNLDQLESKFWEVSTPGSSNYRNFLSKEEILDIVKPAKQDRDIVVAWLMSHGIKDLVDMGDAFAVTSTVHIAQNLFRTFFHEYTSTAGKKVIRTYGSYSVDPQVSELIEMVTGIATFPVPHLRSHRGAPLDNQGIIAQSLEVLYGITSDFESSSNTSQAVIEFQGENFNPADLTAYATQVNLDLSPVSALHTIGPNDATNPQTEASLDIDMIASVNREAVNWFWLESGNGWLYDYGINFFATSEVPQVVSISYGWWEDDQCTIDPAECSSLGVDSSAYVSRVNVEFQKIGLRGVSILSASGDSGANGRTDDSCTIPQLRAAFPGSSPYVTTVGATELANPVFKLENPPPICSTSGYTCASGGSEQAVSYAISSFASGGGFSNLTTTPEYQKEAVSGYLASGIALPPASYFNASGRGSPDVSAIGHNTLIYQSGVQAVGGTSASTPIWAGIISLLNGAAIKKDGKPLGFLNPLLYKIAAEQPSAFHDITVGDNKCTEYGCASTCQGFLATKGWDPVTGLGSPNFPALLKYVQTEL